MAVIQSKVVPTEYDVWEDGAETYLMDDRGRRFRARTAEEAFALAETAQDPTDPIHHKPYPYAQDVPLGSW